MIKHCLLFIHSLIRLFILSYLISMFSFSFVSTPFSTTYKQSNQQLFSVHRESYDWEMSLWVRFSVLLHSITFTSNLKKSFFFFLNKRYTVHVIDFIIYTKNWRKWLNSWKTIKKHKSIEMQQYRYDVNIVKWLLISCSLGGRNAIESFNYSKQNKKK